MLLYVLGTHRYRLGKVGPDLSRPVNSVLGAARSQDEGELVNTVVTAAADSDDEDSDLGVEAAPRHISPKRAVANTPPTAALLGLATSGAEPTKKEKAGKTAGPPDASGAVDLTGRPTPIAKPAPLSTPSRSSLDPGVKKKKKKKKKQQQHAVSSARSDLPPTASALPFAATSDSTAEAIEDRPKKMKKKAKKKRPLDAAAAAACPKKRKTEPSKPAGAVDEIDDIFGF